MMVGAFGSGNGLLGGVIEKRCQMCQFDAYPPLRCLSWRRQRKPGSESSATSANSGSRGDTKRPPTMAPPYSVSRASGQASGCQHPQLRRSEAALSASTYFASAPRARAPRLPSRPSRRHRDIQVWETRTGEVDRPSFTAPMSHDLAFSCEAARVILQCSQDAARLRLLQRRVRQRCGPEHRPRRDAPLMGWTRLRSASARSLAPPPWS
jgi:hypothetical protein